MSKFPEKSLYFVTSEVYSANRTTLEIAREAIENGIDILQMREKNKTHADLLELGKKLAHLCRKKGVILIINDDPNLAVKVGADGVHLGQEDLQKFPLEKTRKILGNKKIIGVSTHSVEQFQLANEADFDYIAFGPIFFTKTKNYSIGLQDVEKVMQIAKKPVVFIGGIDLQNVGEILERGGRNIAVIRAITEAEDIKSQIINFKLKMKD